VLAGYQVLEELHIPRISDDRDPFGHRHAQAAGVVEMMMGDDGLGQVWAGSFSLYDQRFDVHNAFASAHGLGGGLDQAGFGGFHATGQRERKRRPRAGRERGA
jgi:hypothetical protein